MQQWRDWLRVKPTGPDVESALDAHLTEEEHTGITPAVRDALLKRKEQATEDDPPLTVLFERYCGTASGMDSRTRLVRQCPRTITIRSRVTATAPWVGATGRAFPCACWLRVWQR